MASFPLLFLSLRASGGEGQRRKQKRASQTPKAKVPKETTTTTMGRAPCCDKANVKKGPWSPEEDAKLKAYIEQHGTGGNWIALPQKIGLKRCGKSCRLRWLNYLRPNIKHGGFSEEEDNIICSLYTSIGSRWSIIAAQLPGRTDNDIKNYWNTRLKKKLLGKQRKDHHHHHHQGRQSAGMRQEAKTADESTGNRGVLGEGGSRSAYWPEPAMPVYPTGQLDHRVDDDGHASMRQLLMKCEARFSNDSNASLQSRPFIIPTLPPIFDDSANEMTTLVNTTAAPFGEGLQSPNGFADEIDELLRNPVKLEGLDYLYGGGGGGGGGGMVADHHWSTTSEGMNWCEVSPLIYPNVVPSYQGMQQYCLFEEPVHLIMQ